MTDQVDLRKTALDKAVEAYGRSATADGVVQAAEKFYEYLSQDSSK